MSIPTLSFIVPAHNEEQLLGPTLAALRGSAAAARESYEIIVVNDSSTDRTRALAEAARVTVLDVAHRQIAKTRNAGAAAARGRLLVFVDADTIVPPGTLVATLEAWRSGAVGGGASVFFDGRVPLAARAIMPVFRAGMRAFKLAAGCYIFCTDEAFTAAGGFDERLFASEDVALSRALRRVGRFVVLRESVVSSARKLRTFSGLEFARFCLAALTRGPGIVKSRDHLDLWYGARRHDPESTSR